MFHSILERTLAPLLVASLFPAILAAEAPASRHLDFGDCVLEVPKDVSKAAGVPLGPRRLLVLIVDFQDETVENTYNKGNPVDFVRGVMYDNPRNTAGAILESSFGKTWIDSDADGDGEHDILQVTIPSTIIGATCDQHGWADQADQEAVGLGVDLSLYDNKMYVIPLVNGCGGWAGRAQLGGVRSWMRTVFETAYPHELGHNLGMHHAATDLDRDGEIDLEYGDFSDVMGSAPEWRQFNAPHKVQLQWLPSSSVEVLGGGGTQVFTLASAGIDPDEAAYPQVLQVSRPEAPHRPYYLSYRAPDGYDATLREDYVQRLQVHNADVNESVQTHFVAALSDGESFEDAVAHDLVVTQLFHGPTSVTFEVQRNEPDLDADGFGELDDCDDLNPLAFPSAPEVCDGVDNDCNGEVDESLEADPDGDTLCGQADNCEDLANPLQGDADQDGVGDACDCGPEDPAVSATIAPVTDLRFTSKSAFRWSAPDISQASGAITFDVLHSADPRDFQWPSCVIAGTTGQSGTAAPTTDAVTYYLVRIRSACGEHLGLDAQGQRRTAGICREF